MAQLDLLPSEVVLLEQALRNKERKLRIAQRIMEKAEEQVDEALNSIFERAGVEETHGKPRLLRGIDGKPAKITWRDPSPKTTAASPSTNETVHATT